jgi:hypothetical protein
MIKYLFATLMVVSIISITGCKSNELQFSEIVKVDILKISSRNPGTGKLYSITDKEKIAHFVTLMNSTTYSKVRRYDPVTGNSSLMFYNGKNELITGMASNGKGVFKIGDKYYQTKKTINDELSTFYKELYSNDNLIQE